MTDRTLSIGELARASGLSISALRFYDGAGVLLPAAVDPANGYRWYTREQVTAARLIAVLRRVGLPLAEMSAVLRDALVDPVAAAAHLDRHLTRLEDGLADARRALDSARHLLEHPEDTVTSCTVDATQLTAALDAVRFAVSTDPEHPELGGILFDFDADAAMLRLVASDRYRLAVARVPAVDTRGSARRVIAPLDLLDAWPGEESGGVRVELTSDELAIGSVRGAGVAAAFPDWEQLPVGSAQELTIDAVTLRERLAAGPTRTMTRRQDGAAYEVSILRAGSDTVEIVADDGAGGVGVNRDFLLEAIAAGGAEQLVLALNGPFHPLAIRAAGGIDAGFSILMPARLSDWAG